MCSAGMRWYSRARLSARLLSRGGTTSKHGDDCLSFLLAHEPRREACDIRELAGFDFILKDEIVLTRSIV